MKKLLLASVLTFGLPSIAYGQSDSVPDLMKKVEDATQPCVHGELDSKSIEKCMQREQDLKKLEKLGWCIGIRYNSNLGPLWIKCDKKERNNDIDIPYGQSELYFNRGLVR